MSEISDLDMAIFNAEQERAIVVDDLIDQILDHITINKMSFLEIVQNSDELKEFIGMVNCKMVEWTLELDEAIENLSNLTASKTVDCRTE